ncbi:MAG: hypothetical protein KGO93_04110 [Cyanobacteria bacterium REEB446]|nr:hypothetical protein [Cyanobacteria bacterium REEB446]
MITDVDSTANRIQDARDNINVNRSGGDNALKSTGVNMAKMDIRLSQIELVVYDGELSSANIELQAVQSQLFSKKAEMAEEAHTVASQNAKFTERYQSAFTNVWDKDKDGTLNAAEVISFGWKAEDWNKHVLKHDKSGDGKMDFDELLSVWRQFDKDKNGNLDGTPTTGEVGTYHRGDYSKVSDSIVGNNSSIRLEINTLENKEKDYKAAITRLTPLRAAAESNLVNANEDLINYEAMDDSELTDDPSTRKSMEQKSLDLTRRANNLGSFMAASSLVQATDFDELGVSEADMLRGEVSADRRFRMNKIDYIDKGLERTDTRNDATAKLISGLARLAEASTFEEKSIQYDKFQLNK